MTRIRLITGLAGGTDENPIAYAPGQILDVDDAIARAWCAAQTAELVEDAPKPSDRRTRRVVEPRETR